jgi:hypothetical protein
MVSYNYNRNRYRQPSAFTQMRQTQEVLGETQKKLSEALTKIKELEDHIEILLKALKDCGHNA